MKQLLSVWSITVLIPLIVSSEIAAIQFAAGQRCKLVQSNDKDNGKSHPPLVLMGGMAQTIASWEPHLSALSKDRTVLVYECLGQGPIKSDDNAQTKVLLQDVSLPTQADRLAATLKEVFSDENPVVVDLVGFSLGGRVAMAMKLMYPDMVRKLHLTGIASERSPAGYTTISSWKNSLSKSDMKAFANAALETNFSPEFLRQQEARREMWVRFICENNTPEGLLALVEQTYDENDEWSTKSMATRLDLPSQGQLIVGEFDKMAPVQHATDLCQILKWNEPIVLEGCGHAVPMESSRIWRNHVLRFLNQ